jgi:hypothetical protein
MSGDYQTGREIEENKAKLGVLARQAEAHNRMLEDPNYQAKLRDALMALERIQYAFRVMDDLDGRKR